MTTVKACALGMFLAAAGCGGGKSHEGSNGAAGSAAGSSGSAGTSGSAGAASTAGSSGAGVDAATSPLDAAVDAIGPGGGDATCAPARLDRLAPDLLLLLDRSGSMTDQINGERCPVNEPTCETRWGDVTTAVNQVVKETETSIRWGLKYFPDSATCGVVAGAAVDVGAKTADAIAASIKAHIPGGSTPTRVAVTSAGDYLTALTDPNPKAVLLATDGLPNCVPGAQSDAQQLADDSAATIAAITTLVGKDVPVYVIGIGTVVTEVANLQMLAIAGGRPHVGDTAYYPVASSADLVDALHAIGAQAAPCSYALPGVPPRPQEVVISANRAVIPRDPTHANGWDFDSAMKSIELYGTWCTQDRAGTLMYVEASATCASGP